MCILNRITTDRLTDTVYDVSLKLTLLTNRLIALNCISAIHI